MYYMTYSMAHFEVRRFKNVSFFLTGKPFCSFFTHSYSMQWLCCVVLQFCSTIQGVFAQNIYGFKQIVMPPLHSVSWHCTWM